MSVKAPRFPAHVMAVRKNGKNVPGTENVAAAVGFGIAATLAAQELETNAAHCLRLNSKLTGRQSCSVFPGPA